MSDWTPADVIELVKVSFYGIAIVCAPIATVYTMVSAARSKRAMEASLRNSASIASVSTDVARLEKNTNSISERNEAIAKLLGITEGIAQERSSVQANANNRAAILPAPQGPLPVADEKTAAAVDRVVDAIHDTANNTETKG